MSERVVVIGGGAAGFFFAVNYAALNPESEVIILEKNSSVLGKVKISGGGRCNVTNFINDPLELSGFYPRGGKEMIGPFSRFSTNDTIGWFEERGVKLKVESDGRVFPVSDKSQTIIDCLLNEAERLKIKIFKNIKVEDIRSVNTRKWEVITPGENFTADKLMITSGDNASVWRILAAMGHKIIDPVPSLFTFIVDDERIKDLPGISVQDAEIIIKETSFKSRGPILITHNGLSGPAVLKLSAWGARELSEKKYLFNILINFDPGSHSSALIEKFKQLRLSTGDKNIYSTPLFNIPKRLWVKLCSASGVDEAAQWRNISRSGLTNLAGQVSRASFKVTGRNSFKEEFVTSGGVSLKQVNFKTMESKILPGIYFAGEVLNIDALTGGFNFQAAWTEAYIAAGSVGFS